MWHAQQQNEKQELNIAISGTFCKKIACNEPAKILEGENV